jgi:hypothetical protein
MQVCKLLLQRGAQVDGAVLASAVHVGQVPIVQLLLDQGAIPTGRMLEIACAQHNPDLEDLLQAMRSAAEGEMCQAISEGDPDVCRTLFQRGAEVTHAVFVTTLTSGSPDIQRLVCAHIKQVGPELLHEVSTSIGQSKPAVSCECMCIGQQ